MLRTDIALEYHCGNFCELSRGCGTGKRSYTLRQWAKPNEDKNTIASFWLSTLGASIAAGLFPPTTSITSRRR